MEHLLNPLKNDYDTESIAGEHLELIVPGRSEVFGKASYREADFIHPEKTYEFACYGQFI